MNFLKENIPCNLYFNFQEKNIVKSKKFEANFNPFTGSINYKFVPYTPHQIIFRFNSEVYTYKITTLGGRYFIKDYEDSPFKRLFNTNKMLSEKPDFEKKKFKL